MSRKSVGPEPEPGMSWWRVTDLADPTNDALVRAKLAFDAFDAASLDDRRTGGKLAYSQVRCVRVEDS